MGSVFVCSRTTFESKWDLCLCTVGLLLRANGISVCVQ